MSRPDDPSSRPGGTGLSGSAGPAILEIGGDILFALDRPGSTTVLWANAHTDERTARRLTPWGVGGLIAAIRAARSDRTDLLVWHQLPYAPWDPRYVGRVLAKLGPLAIPMLAKQLACFAIVALARVPIVVIDVGDYLCVPRHTLWVMHRARLTFKRELPDDRWRVLAGTLHPRLPTHRMRRRKRLGRTLARMRPLSLGAVWQPTDEFPPEPVDKTVDIFFSGAVTANSTMRGDGLAELDALRAEGYSVDILEERLPRAEFYRRCAQAWLVWSPEGHGWDCFRHYEAPLCSSVPLINRPSITRYRPLRHGIHCILYDPEPGGLAQAARAALADKPALQAMATAARDLVLAHHTRRAGIAHILAEAGIVPGRAQG